MMMKFAIQTAVLAASTLALVSGEMISFEEKKRRELENEEPFWSNFIIQDLDSMATPVPDPTPAPSNIVSNAPSDMEAFSNVPTISGTDSGTSSGTSSGTNSGTSNGTSSGTSSGTTSGTISGTSSETAIQSNLTCESIEDILCSLPEFSTICDLVEATSLRDTFNEDNFTIFAPIDTAFEAIPAEVADALIDVSVLEDILLYHIVPEVEITAENLLCDENLIMANFKDTITICQGNEVFQSGNGNSPDMLPKVIGQDGSACNGIIHAIDQVMLQGMTSAPTFVPTDSKIESTPPTPSTSSNTCQTIAEVICSLPEFELLCALVGDADLIGVLGDEEERYTIFAPTNLAFESLSEELASIVISDSEFLREILLSHTIGIEILSTQLECGGEISMISGQETMTVCANNGIFQRGTGNTISSLPEIIAPDGIACNGVIHAVDQVILPGTDI